MPELDRRPDRHAETSRQALLTDTKPSPVRLSACCLRNTPVFPSSQALALSLARSLATRKRAQRADTLTHSLRSARHTSPTNSRTFPAPKRSTTTRTHSSVPQRPPTDGTEAGIILHDFDDPALFLFLPSLSLSLSPPWPSLPPVLLLRSTFFARSLRLLLHSFTTRGISHGTL